MSYYPRFRRDSSKSRLEDENAILRRELQSYQADVARKDNQLNEKSYAIKLLNEKILAKEKEELRERLDSKYYKDALDAVLEKNEKAKATMINQKNRIRNLELELAICKDPPFKFENKYEQRIEKSLEHTKKELTWLHDKRDLLQQLEDYEYDWEEVEEQYRVARFKLRGTYNGLAKTRQKLNDALDEISSGVEQLQKAKNPIVFFRSLCFFLCILWPLFFILNA